MRTGNGNGVGTTSVARRIAGLTGAGPNVCGDGYVLVGPRSALVRWPSSGVLADADGRPRAVVFRGGWAILSDGSVPSTPHPLVEPLRRGAVAFVCIVGQPRAGDVAAAVAAFGDVERVVLAPATDRAFADVIRVSGRWVEGAHRLPTRGGFVGVLDALARGRAPSRTFVVGSLRWASVGDDVPQRVADSLERHGAPVVDANVADPFERVAIHLLASGRLPEPPASGPVPSPDAVAELRSAVEGATRDRRRFPDGVETGGWRIHRGTFGGPQRGFVPVWIGFHDDPGAPAPSVDGVACAVCRNGVFVARGGRGVLESVPSPLVVDVALVDALFRHHARAVAQGDGRAILEGAALVAGPVDAEAARLRLAPELEAEGRAVVFEAPSALGIGASRSPFDLIADLAKTTEDARHPSSA